MKEDSKLLDAIIDLGVGMKELREEMKGMREEMKGMREDINGIREEINGIREEINGIREEINGIREEINGIREEIKGMQKEQFKTNILLAEHSRSIIKLAEQQAETNAKLDGLRSDFNKYANSNNLIINGHETRIIRLEDATFDNKNKRISMAKEPNAEYKKKKR